MSQRRDHPWGYGRGIKDRLAPTRDELEALKRVPCGYKVRNHGMVIVCSYNVLHTGLHEGQTWSAK